MAPTWRPWLAYEAGDAALRVHPAEAGGEDVHSAGGLADRRTEVPEGRLCPGNGVGNQGCRQAGYAVHALHVGAGSLVVPALGGGG